MADKYDGFMANSKLEPDAPTKEEVFEYLDGLRESGVTNMFGASPYIQEEFGLNKADARGLLMEWMNTFSQRHPSE
jgi:DNA repair photolyase